MRSELLNKLKTSAPTEITNQLIRFVDKATLTEIKQLNKILNKKATAEKEVLRVGEVVVPKEYFLKMQQSGILKYAYDIIDIAARKHPISTLDILTHAGMKPITHKLKTEVGKLLTVAGFIKISVYRRDNTPTKLWIPNDKHIEDELRAEYFFSLLKDHVKLTDTKILDDLI
jgi:hypothetical protein